jgi:hypothetical protein
LDRLRFLNQSSVLRRFLQLLTFQYISGINYLNVDVADDGAEFSRGRIDPPAFY